MQLELAILINIIIIHHMVIDIYIYKYSDYYYSADISISY